MLIVYQMDTMIYNSDKVILGYLKAPCENKYTINVTLSFAYI